MKLSQYQLEKLQDILLNKFNSIGNYWWGGRISVQNMVEIFTLSVKHYAKIKKQRLHLTNFTNSLVGINFTSMKINSKRFLKEPKIPA